MIIKFDWKEMDTDDQKKNDLNRSIFYTGVAATLDSLQDELSRFGKDESVSIDVLMAWIHAGNNEVETILSGVARRSTKRLLEKARAINEDRH